MDNSTLVTKTFKKQVENLLISGKAASYVEIANRIDWNKASMSSVIKGRRNVPIDVYRRFTEEYEQIQPEPPSSQDEAENALIREQFLKNDLIEALKESNKLLKEALDSNISLKKLHKDVLTNSEMLGAVIEILLKQCPDKSNAYKASAEILKRRGLSGIVS